MVVVVLRLSLLVLVVSDVRIGTVRADRLSSYGYSRETTPEIDAFAEHAIRFTDFYSTSSWTVPSHASLFMSTLTTTCICIPQY